MPEPAAPPPGPHLAHIAARNSLGSMARATKATDPLAHKPAAHHHGASHTDVGQRCANAMPRRNGKVRGKRSR